MDEKVNNPLNETLSSDYETGIREFAELLTFLPENQRIVMANVFIGMAVTY